MPGTLLAICTSPNALGLAFGSEGRPLSFLASSEGQICRLFWPEQLLQVSLSHLVDEAKGVTCAKNVALSPRSLATVESVATPLRELNSDSYTSGSRFIFDCKLGRLSFSAVLPDADIPSANASGMAAAIAKLSKPSLRSSDKKKIMNKY
nr:hypothetical protein Iba_scaffold27345CG0010 [Ipomoea batatas]